VVADDDMHVQLADHVTQGGNVHLVCCEFALERFGQVGGFLPQLRLVFLTQVEQFAHTCTLGHQDEPWVIGILAEQQTAQRKVTQHQGVLLQTRIHIKHDQSPTIIICAANIDTFLIPIFNINIFVIVLISI
jgi:hypothetical protein